tara:strand:+ start:7914 stop:8384 length:471 start_codon:yes stop_codon:yes gene_type:complete
MVSVDDVERAQKEWADGIVSISRAYANGGNYVELATNLINHLYAYQIGPVMFKPTLAVQEQFRPTLESALSYFVASNEDCPEDEGFAIKGWTDVRFENHMVTADAGSALAMGNYYFTDHKGHEVKVEYTFGYIEDANSNLRIQLHHSSIPAAGARD